MPNVCQFFKRKEFSIMSIRYVMMNWNIMGRECFTLYRNPLPIIQWLSTSFISKYDYIKNITKSSLIRFSKPKSIKIT